tara:strand:- start:176 stop:400 length:225 start_codon:yes stop_codon:yes gene_type:complete
MKKRRFLRRFFISLPCSRRVLANVSLRSEIRLKGNGAKKKYIPDFPLFFFFAPAYYGAAVRFWSVVSHSQPSER